MKHIKYTAVGLLLIGAFLLTVFAVVKFIAWLGFSPQKEIAKITFCAIMIGAMSYAIGRLFLVGPTVTDADNIKTENEDGD